ncbi:hypothetical protein [Chondrinema litorale]|uniref:hypothetical protein n=1 Tax=Chondrinema litorale TaxID=2994555 RepID=UPI002543244F|nr:hypothetical protein [Chondrinema litorale]UZR92497.1 hypothetical protein OQ292_11560 [Chondrinema litorale]
MKRLALNEVLGSIKKDRIVREKYFTKTVKKENNGYKCYFIDLDNGKFIKEFIKA